MSPIIYNLNNAIYKKNMAAFDYDWTLVKPLEDKILPKDINDWMWLSSDVQEKLKKYHDDDYMIVIFTNQSKMWKCEQIRYVMEIINIPIFIVISMDKEEYKPNPYMFNYFLNDNTIDYEKSFFVGDALGREKDFADSDKLFAENINVKCLSPEIFFNL